MAKTLTPEQLLVSLLPEDKATFPVREHADLEAIRGKTLTKLGAWLKAAVLTRSRDKVQLRLYGWQKIQGIMKARQKFNISYGSAKKLIPILQAFVAAEEAAKAATKASK